MNKKNKKCRKENKKKGSGLRGVEDPLPPKRKTWNK